LGKTKAAQAVTSSSVTDNLISVLLAVGLLPAYAILVQNTGDTSFTEIWIDLIRQIGLIIAAFGVFGILGILILPGSRMKLDIAIPHAFQRGWQSRITYFVYKIRKLPGFYDLSKLLGSVRISVPLIFLMVFGLALIVHKLGLHPAITAYLTGLILHNEMFERNENVVIDEEMPITHKNLGVFFYFLQEWIGPIFFIHFGITINCRLVSGLAYYYLWSYCGKYRRIFPIHVSILGCKI
jgi:hypothetical protein